MTRYGTYGKDEIGRSVLRKRPALKYATKSQTLIKSRLIGKFRVDVYKYPQELFPYYSDFQRQGDD